MRKKMQKKLLITIMAVFVVFILIFSVLQLTGFIQILSGDYKHTGLVLNTNTQIYRYDGEHHSELIGRKIMEGNTNDVFANGDKTEYITSWQPTGKSEEIMLVGSIKGGTFTTGQATPWWQRYHIMIGEYYWELYLTTINGTRKIADKTSFDDHLIEVTYGSFGEMRFALRSYQLNGWNNQGPQGEYWAWEPTSQWNTVVFQTFTTQPLNFKIKGPVVGGLEARLMVQYAELQLNNQWETGTWYKSTKMMQKDTAYLLSGVGDIEVESVGFKRIIGTEQDDWGEVYTHYLFEEGGTVTVNIDAMYSGNEWSLRLYNSNGQSVQTWGPAQGLVDDVVGWKAHYTIPSGAWIRNDPNNNEWHFALYNALFQVDKERIFTIDAYANAPGQTTITTDKLEYTQGDTIRATFSAQKTSDNIVYFRCWARYGTTGNDYALPIGNFQVDEVQGNVYKTHIAFTANKGAKWLYIVGLAYDSAGRPGFEGEKQVYITQAQPVHSVTINVVDSANSNPLSGVRIRFGNDTKTTDDAGTVSFSVKSGTYSVYLAKKDYTSISREGIFINHQTELNYAMVYDGVSPGPEEPDALAGASQYIIYILIGIVIFIGVLYSFMYYQKRKRMQR